ncbi:beta-aspartyl-peptidase [Thalassotalea mangrovi]|uniref:Isoaspartyl dipeptidase n=1 Tax=Thalassotalea mangrovi TaxID=2572245 RepID=A0A4U1B9N2_9GAMM|nr:beta-aspartyl-peptidase [Thalassotalea mangrovi]TKB47490.1 beta-aspartyl-peptidase [Thalassotalea mangrovi]
MILIKQADVYTPQHMGRCDVLIGGDKILKIAENLEHFQLPGVEIIDGQGHILAPGFVDSLVHVTGGGGEGGYTTRTCELDVNDAIEGGVTTLVGALGTDSITQTLEALVGKTKELNQRGINAYCYTGSYHFPAKTLTGSVDKDIMMVEEIIGVGEVAIADHRGSQPNIEEMARLASEARVGGMLSGKAGIVSIHVGDGEDKLTLLHQVSEQTNIPIQQFYPTHINRSQSLLVAGIKFAQAGGYIDFTTSTNEQILASGEIDAPEALALALESGIDISQITMSSDGNASLPLFDDIGNLVELQMGRVTSLHRAFVSAVQNHQVSIENALASITSSPATILKLANKGRVEVSFDADINLLDKESLDVQGVISKGRWLKRNL